MIDLMCTFQYKIMILDQKICPQLPYYDLSPMWKHLVHKETQNIPLKPSFSPYDEDSCQL